MVRASPVLSAVKPRVAPLMEEKADPARRDTAAFEGDGFVESEK